MSDRITIDLRTGKIVDEVPAGAANQISFTRLVEQLRRAGEIRPGEEVTHLEIRPDWGTIVYRVETRA